jgi:hypothetical protein
MFFINSGRIYSPVLKNFCIRGPLSIKPVLRSKIAFILRGTLFSNNIQKCFTSFKITDILQRYLSNLRQSFLGKKCLMRRN